MRASAVLRDKGINMLKVKKGDEVEVLIGKDKGKRGRVERIFPREFLVQVSGINIFKKHRKAQGPKKPGGIIDIVRPLHLSKVAVICPHCGKRAKAAFKLVSSKKFRYCRACKGEI